MGELEKLRKEIDDIDERLVDLFERRMKKALDIVEYKKKNGLPVFDREREEEVIKKSIAILKDGSLEKEAEAFIKKVIEICREFQTKYITGKK